MELKSTKLQRDIQIASKIASTRDFVHFMGAFYVTLGIGQLVQMRFLRRGPLTISQFPFFAVPFGLSYNLDLAYGNKVERLNREVGEILQNESHWFNEPLRLPPYLEDSYRELQAELNDKLAKVGRPPERDWAVFDQGMTDEEVLDHSYPVTKFLQNNDRFKWTHALQRYNSAPPRAEK